MDDEQDSGRIRKLADAVKREYSLLTGDELTLFIDRDIEWGDEWKARIDQALAGTTFFIPVITPRYFDREECRRELLTFAGHAKSLGRQDLLLSIYYATVPGFGNEEAADDEAVTLIASMQWDDWRELRLEGEESPDYRKRVNHLARRLAEISKSMAERDEQEVEVVTSPEPLADDEPGVMELVAQAEEAFPRFNEAMEQLTAEIERVGELGEDWAPKIQRAADKGAGPAVFAFGKFAKVLAAPAARIESLGKQYATELVTIDPAALSLIRIAEMGLWDGDAASELFESIHALNVHATGAVAQLRELTDTLDEVGSLSRDLRRPLRQMREGLKSVLDSQAVIEEWDRRATQADLAMSASAEGPATA